MPTTKSTTKKPTKAEAKSAKKTPLFFDYKDAKQLSRYLNSFGQIDSRKRTGLSAKQQRALARAIKRARHLAILPFINK